MGCPAGAGRLVCLVVWLCASIAALSALLLPQLAAAEELLRLATGAAANWENQPAPLGQQAGIFKKHGLALEILATQGSGETMQSVIAGAVDIGIGVGTYGALAAFAKGAPVRAIGNQTTGAHDLYWYVRAELLDSVAQGREWQEHRLLNHRVIDQHHRARVDKALRRRC